MKFYTEIIQVYSQKINFYTALLIFFVIPIYTWWLPFIINFWILTWLLQGNFKANFKSGINTKILFTYLAYFGFLALSLLWSSNLKNGYTTFETQLCFVIAPVLFYASNKIYIEKKQWFLYSFIGGSVVSGIFLLGRAFYRAITFTNGVFSFNPIVDGVWEKRNVFFSTEFSFLEHPTYLSMYFLISLLLLLFFRASSFSKQKKYISTVLIIFMGILFFLLSSRSSYILILILLVAAFFRFTIRVKIGIFAFIILFLGLMIFFQYFDVGFRGLTFNDSKSGEINMNIIDKLKKGITLEDIKNSDPRITIWGNAAEIIKQNPIFGVGVGDVKNELVKTYTKNNERWAVDKKFGAHNQYLETIVGQGIVGFVLLMLFVCLSFYVAFTKKNSVWILVLVVITFYMFFESMLNSFAGVVFITMFGSFFSFIRNQNIIFLNTSKVET